MQPGRRSSALKFQINAGSACPCLLHWGCGSKAVWNSSDFVGPSVPKLESNKLLKVWLCPLLLFLLKAFRPFHEQVVCMCSQVSTDFQIILQPKPSPLHITKPQISPKDCPNIPKILSNSAVFHHTRAKTNVCFKNILKGPFKKFLIFSYVFSKLYQDSAKDNFCLKYFPKILQNISQIFPKYSPNILHSQPFRSHRSQY